jgi:hypothetical protein
MAAERKFQSSRWIFLYGIIFIGLVSVRCVTQNAREQNLVPSLVGLSLFSMLYFSERTISKRLKWYIYAYLAIQAVLILAWGARPGPIR